MASPSSIISSGLGSWGSPSDTVTLGYGAGAAILASAANIYRRIITAADDRFLMVRADSRREIVLADDRELEK